MSAAAAAVKALKKRLEATDMTVLTAVPAAEAEAYAVRGGGPAGKIFNVDIREPVEVGAVERKSESTIVCRQGARSDTEIPCVSTFVNWDGLQKHVDKYHKGTILDWPKKVQGAMKRSKPVGYEDLEEDRGRMIKCLRCDGRLIRAKDFNTHWGGGSGIERGQHDNIENMLQWRIKVSGHTELVHGRR